MINEKIRIFKESLNETLLEISALEINTEIVKDITPNHFIPWEAYQEIYLITKDYLQQKRIEESFWDRYLDLRYKLELEYALLLTNPASDLYKPNTVLPILTEPNLDWEQYEKRLPSPFNSDNPEIIIEIQILLKQPSFLRSLRKLGNIKSSLDLYHNNLTSKNKENQGFFAQTIIQLDGNIINRYSPELLKHPQQKLLFTLHQKSVTEAEKQWEGLLQLLVRLIKSFTKN
jgi:hypothetical protein